MTIPLQTRVRHGEKTGTVCPDCMSCCTPEEIPVVFDGETAFLGILESELEILGLENATPNPEGCGVGQGEDCCIFLTVGAKGFECERFSSLRFGLIFRTMTAKRNPSEPYPKCMNRNMEPSP